jgi:hypothetical protein
MSQTPHKPKPPDTPRVSIELRNLFLDQLDQRTGSSPGPDRRRNERLPHRVHEGLVVTFSRTDGADAHYLVHPRNISRGGMGFLHEAYLQPETECRVSLYAVNEGTIEVSGRVVDCRRISGRLHEVGVAFSEPLNLARVKVTPAEAASAQHAE